MGLKGKAYRFLVGKIEGRKERNYLEDANIDGRITVKRISEMQKIS